MLFTVVGLSFVLVTGSAADITGKWEGKIVGERPTARNPRTRRSDLVQKDSTVTGTVGGSETDQHPITSGTIAVSR